MLFNSPQFLMFFVIVTLLYFLIPKKYTVSLLLFASVYFYMVFKPVYILILFFTIIIDYIAGIYLQKFSGRKKRAFLILSLVANIGVLAYFKYFNFLNNNLDHLLGNFQSHTPFPFLKILLPIGLSFHTFQAMSYTIEVYRGNQEPERNFLVYALYVMFYPQLVAGPIERPQNMLHQFHEKHYFDYTKFKAGILLMAIGFFKKVVIADRLSLVVDSAYADALHQNGSTYLISSVFYSFQIYCDFSGYSDIAIGSAMVMGYDLMQNFRSPYFSGSVTEFWGRWHISLSTWFRDYLYIPLGGNRVKQGRYYFNIFIVFLLSGLWHGANWTFVIWGIIHAGYMILASLKNKALAKININLDHNRFIRTLNVFITFFLVTIAWVFFRAPSIGQATEVIKTIFSISFQDKLSFSLNNTEMWFSVFLIGLLLLKDGYYPVLRYNNNLKYYTVLTAIILSCYFFGVFRENQFIYFQF